MKTGAYFESTVPVCVISREVISLSIFKMYHAKKRTPQEAVSIIKSGDVVFTGGDPSVLYKALADTAERYENVRMYSMFGLSSPSAEYLINMRGHISLASSIFGREQAKRWPDDSISQIPGHFSELESFIEQLKPDVVLFRGCPMDDNGYIYLGNNHGVTRAAIDVGAKAIVQVDKSLPYVYTDYYRVHISEVEALCEYQNPEKKRKPERPITEKEENIAAYIAERIPNGATIQLGVGGVPNAVGMLLGEHKDLGIHTEVFTDSMTYLMKKGVVNNSKKTLLPGVSIAGFLIGNAETEQFSHKNRNIMLKKLAWVNCPETISQIHNMISINSCLGVDLYGQICSESIGMSNTGGIGGQLNFVEGASKSPGGKSFLAMHAAVEKQNGEKISKITLHLPRGSVVTTPRADVEYIVTEYGIANLRGKSIKERAQSLINIADPDFRDQLTFDAKRSGLL